jgi:hypothetical protein
VLRWLLDGGYAREAYFSRVAGGVASVREKPVTAADRRMLRCWMAAMRAKHIPRVAGGVASVREKPVTAAGRRMLRCWMAVMRAKHIPEGGGRCCVGAREAPDSFSRAWKGRGCSDDGCWSIIAAGNRLADAKGQVAQAGLDPIVDVVQKAAGCHDSTVGGSRPLRLADSDSSWRTASRQRVRSASKLRRQDAKLRSRSRHGDIGAWREKMHCPVC